MIKTIAIVIVVLLASVLLFAATRPDTFRVERSITIHAPAEKIYPFLEDFRRWNVWSPYENKDPAMKRTYGGATSGKGATYAWDGNKDIGSGSMEIADTSPPSRLTLKLDFTKPFVAHNIVDFTLAPSAGNTQVTWAMHGPNTYVGKVMQLFFNMDSMVGKDFEAGLTSLKSAAEK